MLDKLKRMKEHINQGKHAFSFDPSRFNDPLANQIQWTSLKSGGSNFRSHNLVEVNPNRMEFRQSLNSKLFSFVFMLAGLLIPVFFIFGSIDLAQEEAWKMVAFVVVFGLVFIGTGYFSYKRGASPVVFDKMIGKFWKGKEGPDVKPELMNAEQVKNTADIHALQLISEYVRRDKNSYYSYEINCIMKDTKRYNVMKHGAKTKIRRDAETLAQFLGKPLWDAAG